MTTKEIRTKIAESNDPGWFNTKQVTLNFPHINFSTTIIGVSAIYEFFKQQVEGWLQKDIMPDELQPSKKIAEDTVSRIENLFTNTYNRNSVWNEITSDIENRYRKYFTYEVPEVD